MMDDLDLRNLRPYGALLRHDVDVPRLVAGLLDRIRAQRTVAAWLAEWLRPLAAAAAVMAVLAGAAVYREIREVPDLAAMTETRILAEVSNVLR